MLKKFVVGKVLKHKVSKDDIAAFSNYMEGLTIALGSKEEAFRHMARCGRYLRSAFPEKGSKLLLEFEHKLSEA